MGFMKGKKRIVASTVVSLVIAGSGVAYAYFTSTGSGTGSATVGSSTALTITQTNTIAGLLPGGSASPVQFTILNDSGGNENLGLVSASVSSVTLAEGHPSGTCSASDFTVTAGTTVVGSISNGSTYDSTTASSGSELTSVEPTVAMKETGSNQDACQGATVNLTLTAAQGS